MAMKPCRDCGHNCSTHGLMCPGCGRIIGGRAWWANTIVWGVFQAALISFVLLLLIAFLIRALIGIPGTF
jgi:hypothetical protein